MEFTVCIDGGGGETFTSSDEAIHRAVELKTADPEALISVVVDTLDD